ncbi:hypothetical protein [Lacimicrobium alkaliphilum]|uniref:Uncharacterized protein n=1 Tax=Lacimicrobium alkaliphilum TaxID=1526571 RepID=A0A0U3BDJ8_9ALTE|nr:hypothetical protein [Lacimicrobium alkaliphilum]ALS99733.1 hypothetical protein AT746_16645 [Lacimicrobium alkaliphilum]
MQPQPYENLETLLSALSVKRYQLLRTLAKYEQGITIKQLASLLGRNYKNVHSDVGVLRSIGLIAQTGHPAKIYTPHKRFVSSLDLTK